MLQGEPDAAQKAASIVDDLSSHEETKSHARHIHVERLKELGLTITELEDDKQLQDAVLTVHHACINTLQQTNAVKIIENHTAVAFIVQAVLQQIPMTLPFQIPQLPVPPPPLPQPQPHAPRADENTDVSAGPASH